MVRSDVVGHLRLDNDGDDAKAERLDALSQFQLEIVVHALK